MKRTYGRSVLKRGCGGVILICLLCMQGCSRFVPYKRDIEQSVGDEQAGVADTLPTNIVREAGYQINHEWWTEFNDPQLTELVESAVTNNIDIKMMLKRVALAKLAVVDTKHDRLFKLSSTVGQPGQASSRDQNFESRTKMSAHVAWEADLWGRLASLQGAALDEWEATEAESRGVYLKVINDIANIYFNIRMLDEQADLHRWALRDAERALEIYTRRAEKGLVRHVRVDSQKAEVLRHQGDLIDIQRQRELLVLQLNLICGQNAGQIELEPADLTESIAIPAPPPVIGLDMLQRRPDVIAAEFRLREAFKLERAAQVARYPQLTLDLDYSLSAQSLTSLTDNWVLSFLPQISFPSLDPATKTELERQGIQVDTKQLEFKKSLLTAVSDLENALVNVKYRSDQLTVEKSRAEALQRSYDSTMRRFEGGLISHLEVFEAERSLIHSRQAVLEQTRLVLSETSHLFISLGGGW